GVLCSCHQERPLYERVQLELAGPDDASMLGQNEEQVKGELVDALKGAGFRSASEASEPKGAWRLAAALALQDVKEPQAPARAEAVLQLKRPGDDTDREVTGRGEANVKGQSLDERRDASRAAVELALKDAAEKAALLLRLLGKSDAELIGAKDPKAKDL